MPNFYEAVKDFEKLLDSCEAVFLHSESLIYEYRKHCKKLVAKMEKRKFKKARQIIAKFEDKYFYESAMLLNTLNPQLRTIHKEAEFLAACWLDEIPF